ncbi:Gfo/Idh/MocA family oxidoreductase [candidate division KSB1 bacterium]|nr:Gfo/Idh/MocA family oxidoreductase [candidate division KSB1 bacterium]
MAHKKLKVGIIGVGGVAQAVHLAPWQELQSEGKVEFLGACDLIEERAQLAVNKFGAKKAYVDYNKMLEDDEYDIIDICTQNRGHCPIAVDALNSGANVIVEKPIAMNVAEAQKMIQTAKANKRKLMTAQNQRFESAYEQLKSEIDAGKLGQIYTASTRYLRRRGIPGWGKFHIAAESRGGPLIDIGVHFIDLCMWFLNFPKPLSTVGKVYRMFGDREDLCNGSWGFGYPLKEFDVEDYALAFVRLEGGISMIVETCWAANIRDEVNQITVLGDKAGISTNPAGLYGYSENALTHTGYDWLPEQKSHRMEIRHFAECVEKDLPVRVRPEESLRVQQIIDAIYQSSQENKEIVIKPI